MTGRRDRGSGRLVVKGFGQIESVDLTFGDLTVLVGAQGTGKSLSLQWLKAVLDGKHVARALTGAGYLIDSPRTLVDLFFGVGMGAALTDDTSIEWNGTKVAPASIPRRGRDVEQVFFIPAHRSTLISNGWAQPFQNLSDETPMVARLFSQRLFELFSARGNSVLFPADRVLKRQIRELIDDAVFHSGRVLMEQDQHKNRLRLAHGDMELPFMTWTAGQREFTPLLLGLYHLLPSTKLTKRDGIDWVVIEEPEMGLHPKAVSAVFVLMLELIWRGYKVVVSTHSAHLLTAMWALNELRGSGARWQLLLEGLGIGGRALRPVAEAGLAATCQVHLLSYDDDYRVRSKDISTLDPESDDELVSDWGGLTGVSDELMDAVARAVNEKAA